MLRFCIGDVVVAYGSFVAVMRSTVGIRSVVNLRQGALSGLSWRLDKFLTQFMLSVLVVLSFLFHVRVVLE